MATPKIAQIKPDDKPAVAGKPKESKDTRQKQQRLHKKELYNADPKKYIDRTKSWYAANHEKARAQARERYRLKKANASDVDLNDEEEKAKRNAAAKKYREAHPDKVLVSAKRYKDANLEKIRDRESLRYISNKEEIDERHRLYRLANPDVFKALIHRRRARIKNSPSNTLTSKQWIFLKGNSPHCHWCKLPWTKSRKPTIDHVIPLAKGGAHSIENVVAACRSCNAKKRDHLFNPVTKQGILL